MQVADDQSRDSKITVIAWSSEKISSIRNKNNNNKKNTKEL